MPTKNPTKEQQARWNRVWYEKNKDKRADWNKKRREQLRDVIDNAKRDNPCPCGESDIDCLVFHHLDPNNKDFTIGNIRRDQWGRQRLLDEIAKCQVLCSNCHLKFHAKLRRSGSLTQLAE